MNRQSLSDFVFIYQKGDKIIVLDKESARSIQDKKIGWEYVSTLKASVFLEKVLNIKDKDEQLKELNSLKINPNLLDFY